MLGRSNYQHNGTVTLFYSPKLTYPGVIHAVKPIESHTINHSITMIKYYTKVILYTCYINIMNIIK